MVGHHVARGDTHDAVGVEVRPEGAVRVRERLLRDLRCRLHQLFGQVGEVLVGTVGQGVVVVRIEIVVVVEVHGCIVLRVVGVVKSVSVDEPVKILTDLLCFLQGHPARDHVADHGVKNLPSLLHTSLPPHAFRDGGVAVILKERMKSLCRGLCVCWVSHGGSVLRVEGDVKRESQKPPFHRPMLRPMRAQRPYQ